MNLGYVSIIKSIDNIKMKTCILKNANRANLCLLIEHNLNTLDQILEYNKEKNIHLYRLTSKLIPFGSHPTNKIKWWDKYKLKLKELGDKAKRYHIRLSMHPGQYTTLSTPNEEVLKKSITDLKYHAKVLDSMGLDESNKLIIHIGGRYEGKNESIKRFISNYNKLPINVKSRIVIENDDKIYNVDDLLYISKKIKAPVVFDVFHHRLNHNKHNLNKYLKKCRKTWKKKDGIQKIHYSQQNINKRRGCHSETIDEKIFFEFYKNLPYKLDIMLEVKDKDISTLKCMQEIKKRN